MTSTRTKVQRLEAAGIDEERIAEVLGLTLQKTRRLMQNPPEKLSAAAREEIFYADIDDAPRSGYMSRLASQYCTTPERVAAARRARTKTCATPPESELRRYVDALGLEEACTTLGCSHAYARDTLGLRRQPPPTQTVRELLQKKMTYGAIATVLGCTEAYVKQIAYRNGWTSRVNNKRRDDWPEILQYAADTSVAEAARRYGVTRANIYYWRKKND